ncbi:dTMP kinase [Sinomonas sp. P10A9]|uniref:Thymidylate kinase n=1 Tax=Sinomonas puerhi TaxID=3238584 RepID=A0AB39L318_9MICC
MTMSRGRFIVFEGIDASGKSTQVKLLSEYLESLGEAVHVTAEPTAGPVGSLIRQAFAERVPLDDRTIAALFVADRVDHLTNSHDGILDLIARGVTVICDRYYLSSLAYHAGDVDASWIEHSNSISTDLLRPDLTVYIDVDPDVAGSRLMERRERIDKFEVRDRLLSAYKNYEDALPAAARRESVVRVAGDRPREEVFNDVIHAVQSAGLVSV